MGTPTSTGKVKVEYSDPSSLFQLITSEFQARLPLRNLNWASSSRPTRSIDSLYVELIPDEKNASTSSAKRATPNNGPPDSPASPTPSGEFKRSDSQSIARTRRHQIPGLRRTPYLKIFLLRCDDTDTYKATARRAVREWIKTNSSSSSNSQDNHDAFEYMIIHVVLPDVQNGATWPTKASASVLEKLKSDFNSSSRSTPDRVVQIPATKHLQVQGMTINPVPAGPAREVFLQESNRVWDDLIAKMKLLILGSFDSRVKQYEEDIKEKGLQRHLPGWNFCTFFVLKEGLARGFESVGLIDDALMGYDELAIELLSATREDATKQSRLFREHTQDLLLEAEAALQGRELSVTRPNQKRLSMSFLAVDEKPYREFILASNISVFDFRCYVFARQVHLMLRLASVSGKAMKANSSAVDLIASRDPVILADICWRAKDFFADMARVIRQDLKASFKAGNDADAAELKARYTVTENLISSWIYKGTIDILQRTREANLPDAAVTEIVEPLLSDQPVADTNNDSSSAGESEAAVPATNRPQSSSTTAAAASFRCVDGFSMDSARAHTSESATLPSGSSSLAVERAELYLIARRAFASSGERLGWKTAWPTADSDMEQDELDNISLEDTPKDGKNAETGELVKISNSSTAGVLDLSMRNALASASFFYRHWEELSLLAFILFEAAKVQKSVYLITADIAAVRVRLGDYAYAAPFLRELGPKYAANLWHNLEVAVLDMYVFCLGKLNKPEDYVPAALQALGKMINARKVTPGSHSISSKTDFTPFSSISLQGVVELSQTLPKAVQVSLDDFFIDVELGDCLWHSEETDDFGVFLTFKCELTGGFRIDSAIVKLAGTSEEVARREMTLSSGSYECRHGSNVIRLVSKIMIPGRYALDNVLLECGKIRFHRNYRGTSFVDRNLDVVSHKTQQLLLWPSRRACIVEASMFEVIHLSQPRAIIFTVRSNGNDINNAKLLLKSATAGLRLQTSDAEIVSEEGSITNDKQPSIVPLGPIPRDTTIRIKVPYRIEADLREVQVRSELTYEVNSQNWVYGSVHRLMAQLPLGVNVQDIFKMDALFSKFAISTSSDIPIRVLRSKLSENESYNVLTPHLDNGGMVVFIKQPASLVYRISRKSGAQAPVQRKLSLEIEYQCLDEQVVDAAIQHLYRDLEGTSFQNLSVLLQTNLTALLPIYMQEQDLEAIGLLDELRLPDFSNQEWDGTITAAPADDRALLLTWLGEWYKKNSSIFITSNTRSMTRRILIPVEIPTLPVLHTASIVLDEPPASSRPYTLGEIISGEVQISHTRSWSSEESQAQQDELSFVYEIEASTESWLIAGQRRGYFLARENEVKVFPILLMPLRAGKVMMPVIEIRFARDGKEGELSNTSCETDYQGLGLAIEVAPGVTGVTSDVFMNTSGALTGKVKVLGVERQNVASAVRTE